jgi:molecular chaperone GrpE
LAEESIEQEDIEALKTALVAEKEKAEQYLASAQRATADYQNLKKRTEQEKQESLAWSNAELIKLLLPAIDDMERAFAHVDPKFSESVWVEGFRQIQRKIQEVLRSHGCNEIECLGQPFDPNFHEAIGYEDGEEGIVIGEHRKGYQMKNRVLRAAQVTVGKGNNSDSDSDDNST